MFAATAPVRTDQKACTTHVENQGGVGEDSTWDKVGSRVKNTFLVET
jgi:hypothetical protein